MSHGTQVIKIALNDEALETVENFLYLGSVMSNNFTLDMELNTRLGKAVTSFGRLSKRVWSNKSLTLHTNLAIYRHEAANTSIVSRDRSWPLLLLLRQFKLDKVNSERGQGTQNIRIYNFRRLYISVFMLRLTGVLHSNNPERSALAYSNKNSLALYREHK